MRFVLTSHLIEGMRLGKNLYGKNEGILLKAETTLNRFYIDRIKLMGFNGVYIIDDRLKEVEVKEIINEQLKRKTELAMKEVFSEVEKKSTMQNASYEGLRFLVDNIVDEIIENRNMVVNMVDLKTYDDYTFQHSVNVAILSIVMGVAIGLPREKLIRLCYAGLFHDIGKVFISKDILNKEGQLTEEEFETIKEHSEKGYELIKEKDVDVVTSYVGILQHHERYDGTGYPKGLRGEQISLFGRIIAIADVYDALTSDRPYRKAVSAFEAMEFIMGGGDSAFDLHIVSIFSQNVAPYPLGTAVVLNDGRVGFVIENYADSCLRPKLKIVRHGEIEVEPYYLDLRNDREYLAITIKNQIYI